jgi:hypothetical protein
MAMSLRPGRSQRLRQHLTPERPLQLGVGLPSPEQAHLDLLEVEQLDELVDRLGHERSLVLAL